MRVSTTSAAAIVTAALLALITACGSQAAGNGASSSTPSTPSTPRSPVSLTITVRPDAHAAVRRWSLTCQPTGGSLPTAAAACSVLSRVHNPFAPVPRGMMCSMIYSGPQTATIEGTWHGQHVHSSFNRVNGCQTQRWARIAPVFGPYATPPPGAG